MTEEEKWGPSQADVEWTEQHLSSLAQGGVWAPGGTGLTYERTGDKELSLRSITQHPETLGMHDRVIAIIGKTDWDLVEGDYETIDPPLNPMEAQYQQMMQQQEVAARWDCPNEDCQQRLVDMPLEEGRWVDLGQQSALDEEGKVVEVERWIVAIECDACDAVVNLDPQDYGMLGGDELFFRWQAPDSGPVFTTLTREQVVDMVDSGVDGDTCVALGTDTPWGPVPPHMRGTYCLRSYGGEEE